MTAIVDINSLNVTIDKKPILSDINASVAEGKIIGLLGPSGAGKTTLIRSILGLQKVSAGEIRVFDKKAGDKSLFPLIGYSTQSPAVYPDLSVMQNMKYFASLFRASSEEVRSILYDVELDSMSTQLAGSLSGGELARLSLGVALLGNPSLLLLDEPTVGLDPVLRVKLWGYFRSLAAKGITIVLTSHVMDEAERCDEIMFIRSGSLLVHATKHDIYKQTKTDNMEDAFLRLAKETER